MSQSNKSHDARVYACLDEALPAVELSIEIFPPKSPEARERLWRNLELFAAANPRFISVTCGAGGTEQGGTATLVSDVQRRFGIPTAAHLTCAGAPRATTDAIARAYWEQGVRRVVALRGDPPKGAERYEPHPEGYAYASDLVAGLKEIAEFDISVGCYPETHPEAVSARDDLDNLKRKVDAGAGRIISQYCFDTNRVLRFRDTLDEMGIDVEFVPGIMPIHNFNQIKRFSLACGAGIPAWLEDLFAGVEEGSAIHGMIAASVVSEQCRRLAAEGLTRFHVYALNRAELPIAIMHLLNASRPMSAAA